MAQLISTPTLRHTLFSSRCVRLSSSHTCRSIPAVSKTIRTERWVSSRAAIYSKNGDPLQEIRSTRYELPELEAGHARVKVLLAALNPADINVIQGVYPNRPKKRKGVIDDGEVFIGGNEGVGVVEEVNSQDGSLKAGDRVIFGKSQMGTWQTRLNAPSSSFIPVPHVSSSHKPISDNDAAALTINPSTAFRMLTDFVNVRSEEAKGVWVIQNGANSAVGQAVCQLCKAWGVKNIALVRHRDDVEDLKRTLTDLGATHVFTYDDLADKSTRHHVKELVKGSEIKLGFNCVGGQPTTDMIKLLGSDAFLVTYGAMSKQPFTVPNPLYIFNRFTSTGFWMNHWYNTCSRDQRDDMTRELVGLMEEGKLSAPPGELVTIGESDSDEEASKKVKQAIEKTQAGFSGKKVYFAFE